MQLAFVNLVMLTKLKEFSAVKQKSLMQLKLFECGSEDEGTF